MAKVTLLSSRLLSPQAQVPVLPEVKPTLASNQSKTAQSRRQLTNENKLLQTHAQVKFI
jgi:hypothetical protein